ncbi:MAG TPA: ribosome maturation factor RimM, partial [Patescibacteria group bacterium]|nr:ribosome maturation factor RimM [Patescibacteria group bacterium]
MRGLVGEVVVTVHADDPARMAALGTVFLREAEGGYRPVAIEGFKRLGDRAVLKLAGFGSIEEARVLIGRELFIPVEASTPAPEGRYYAYQLVGLEARLKDGTPLGKVREVLRQGAQSLL